MEPRTDKVHVRNEILANLIHHEIAEALDKAHHRLDLAEFAPLIVGHETFRPALPRTCSAKGAAKPADGFAVEKRDAGGQGCHLPLKTLSQIGPKPRVSFELKGVRRSEEHTSELQSRQYIV